MLYRLKSQDRAVVNVDGVDYTLDPSRDYDDADATEATLVERYREWFRAVPDVEQATAGPGEKRARSRG